MSEHVFLYGPPGSGKSTLGLRLAHELGRHFVDLDEQIKKRAGRSIESIFAEEKEAGFRTHESRILAEVLAEQDAVIALGGGTLLDVRNRNLVESAGQVLLLNVSPELLVARQKTDSTIRPLSQDETALSSLLKQRAEHYASFPTKLEVGNIPLDELAWQAQITLGAFHVTGMGPGYDVRVHSGALEQLGTYLQARQLNGPVAMITDQNVEPLYANRVLAALLDAGYKVESLAVPPGERYKSMETVAQLWEFLLQSGIERSSTVVALGGGVITDLAGFASSTFLRGVPWVAVPTTLLAMADASLGGKTGIDLPQGKNLVGAFYPPRLVLSDPGTLDTLPEPELRSGMGEVIKHGIISDPQLFEMCMQGLDVLANDWSSLVRRAMAVKIKVLKEDPYEQGLRAALNLGHTIGHAVELASGFKLRHGEAIAIGMVAEARLAEKMGLAESGLADTICEGIQKLELPTEIPSNMSPDRLAQIMLKDKKKASGVVRFALPTRIGEVVTGIEVSDLEGAFS
ncbi:MAG: 3-dehydroquinate synthase [Chloroflexi bacterium]|nr:MAG: 3-dehydroquinate synthase [Chloroflexota bacterium]MBL1193457.1 3-dehydroquinate synthase [Chloroflexota bacterium]NOH10748.1 3-dehydroquinate synthase [Chloroflexota bacterium]